jgi:DNA-binding transcriptional regulator YdaS (Cro superfamily)
MNEKKQKDLVRIQLRKALDIITYKRLSETLGISRQAIRKWLSQGCMPDTEYSGRTTHALTIEKLTDGVVTYSDLCPVIDWDKKVTL